jgi:hypothetical protein
MSAQQQQHQATETYWTCVAFMLHSLYAQHIVALNCAAALSAAATPYPVLSVMLVPHWVSGPTAYTRYAELRGMHSVCRVTRHIPVSRLPSSRHAPDRHFRVVITHRTTSVAHDVALIICACFPSSYPDSGATLYHGLTTSRVRPVNRSPQQVIPE